MIGIIVLNYLNWKDTIECVKSIQNNGCFESYHIYIVDNNSPNTDHFDLHYLKENREITIIWSKENRGYSAGNNIGIKRAIHDNCDAILISNSDIRFEQNSIDLMYNYLEENKNVGIVGPKVLLKDGSIQKNNIYIKTTIKEKYLVRTKLNILFRKLKNKYFGTLKNYEKECSVYAVSGCCFMISKECISEIKFLDENTFLYDEELIIGIQMEKLFFKTIYYPKAIVTHLHGQSTKQVKPFAFTCMISSEIYYCLKYLNANRIVIIPLYIYRSICYLLRCSFKSDFRAYLKEYFIKSLAAFRYIGIDGKKWRNIK
jgi:GT2 family glycosyltransferase